jgi:hypothetical protein
MAKNKDGDPATDPMFGPVVRGSQTHHQKQLAEAERKRQEANAKDEDGER